MPGLWGQCLYLYDRKHGTEIMELTISFIIPAYNEEKYIRDCLHSIYRQKGLWDFEVIVADNNSEDQTREIVSKEFPQVKVVVENKRGPAAARNAGAKLAKGRYLAFIDADCRLPLGWYKFVEQKFKQDERLVLIYGPYRFTEAKTFVSKFIFFISNVLVFLASELFFRKLLHLGGPANGGDTVVRKDAFDRIQGYNAEFEFYGEDIDFNRRMMSQGRVVFDSGIWVYSSLRRLKAEGTMKMWWIYTYNTKTTIILAKAQITKHRPVR